MKNINDIQSYNFSANFFYKLFEPGTKFIDEAGALVTSIKIEPGDIPIYSKPKIYYDLFPEGMKPRKIMVWNDNYDIDHLDRFDYTLATKTIPKMQRWLRSVAVQTGLFRSGQIPKGWKQIARIPPHHFLRIDTNNFQIQLVGPSINQYGFTQWYPIIYKEEYKEMWEEWFKYQKEAQEKGWTI